MIESGLFKVASSPALLSAAALLLLSYILRLVLDQSQKPKIPVVKLNGGNFTKTMMEAREKYPNKPFILASKMPWVILPHSVVTEVKNLPGDQISLAELIKQRLHGQYTKHGAQVQPEGISAIKNDLTRNVSKVLSDLQDEISYAFDKQIGPAPTWKEKNVYSTVMQIVAHLSARVFVGLPLCRDEEWINAMINLTHDTVKAMNAVEAYKPWLRPFVGHFIPEIRKLHRYTKFFARKLDPSVSAIMTAYQENAKQGISIKGKQFTEDLLNDEVIGENHNLVNWIINNFRDMDRVTTDEVGNIEIRTSFVSIHTTSMGIAYALFDLAANSAYADELRNEVLNVIEEENHPDKQLRKTSVPKLRKLDSFLKESQRVNPPSAVAVRRLVTAKNGITLSDGTKIPFGMSIGFGNPFFPTSTIPKDTIMTSPGQRPLSEFYPWRYSDLRSRPGEENKHQYVTVDADEVSFGSGVHACPGRFYAGNEIKVVLVELLLRYDIALGPNGEREGEGGYMKPKLVEREHSYYPDPFAKISFRERA